MTSVEILKQARELISDPSHWTQEAFARNKNGKACACLEEEGVKWCARGAIYKIGENIITVTALPLMFLDRATGDEQTATYFNDTKTHKDVLELFDAAIALAEAEAEVER